MYIWNMASSKEVVGAHIYTIIVTKLSWEVGYRGNPPGIEALAPSFF